METVYLTEWLLKTSTEKKMVLQKKGFQRKSFGLGNIKEQLS